MMIKLKKAVSFITAVFLTLSVTMCFSINACAATMITAGVSVENTEITSIGDKINVNISLKGIPYAGVNEPNDVILVIDRSSSMNGKYDAMIDAAKEFCKKIDLNTHRIGIVDYETDAYPYALSDNYDAICSNLEQLREKGVDGSTAMDRGISQAMSLLVSKRSNAHGSIVLMTDGVPNDETAAREAATKAKSKGYAFFTVALCNSLTSSANLMLKAMATSESSHYSVFSVDKLNSVYTQIAAKIGNINAKNVVITQDIPSEFNFVQGSADNTIPVPTSVTGDCITWNMNELAQGISTLSYQLELKSEYTPYKLNCGGGSVKYTDYTGTVQTIDLQPQIVYNSIISDITITDIQPAQGETKVVNTVTITGEGFIGTTVYYGSTLIGKNNVTEDAQGKFITIKLPSKASPGTYPIKIANDRNKTATIDFCLIKNEPPKAIPVITDISPKKVLTNTPTTVTLTGENLQGAKVFIGGRVQLKSNASADGKTVTVDIPKKSNGKYTLLVRNNDNLTATVDFEAVNSMPIPEPVINNVQPSTILVNTENTLTVTGENLTNLTETPVKLLLGRTTYYPLSITESADGKSLSVVVPALKTKGSYKLSVKNSQGKEATAAIQVLTEPPAPDMTLTDVQLVGTSNGVTTVIITGTNITNPKSVFINERTSLGSDKYSAAYDGTSITVKFTAPNSLVSGKTTVSIRITNDKGKTQSIVFTYP